MFFKGRRVKKLATQLGEHLAWIDRLRASRLDHLNDALRLEELSDFDRGRVLALNFELASHASRSLSLIRQLEEMGDSTSLFEPTQLAQLRTALRSLEDLPAVPRRDVESLDSKRVAQLWASFIEDRDRFTGEERMVLAQLDLMKVAQDGVFIDVPEGMSREEALEMQKRMADVYRTVDWDAIVRKKMAEGDRS
jgi:hypothetical protein